MQKNNQPVSPSANRSIMPQTGNPEGAFKNALEKGAVNWKQASDGVAGNKINTTNTPMNAMPPKQEWLVLSGLKEVES